MNTTQTSTAQPDCKKPAFSFPYEEYDALLDAGKIHDAIVSLARSWGYLSQGDVFQFLNGAVPTDGHYALKTQANVEVWRGLSKELGEILMDLITSGQLALIGSWSFPLKHQYKRWRKIEAELYLPGRVIPKHIIKPVFLEEQAR